jgi:hypothetical protein
MSTDQDSFVDPRDALIREQAEKIKQLVEEVARLKALLEGKADGKVAKPPKFTENYSLDRNPRRQKKPRKKSTGRKPQAGKLDLATEQRDVYPEGAAREECIRQRSQFAWRILDGKAVYVCYQIHDLPGSRNLPLPLGLRNSRSEFGIEILLILAFLHYWIGVSIDNARQIMEFFTGLKLSKSQADSLLTQLASDWDEQYDTIAELMALQMIVYIDETGWKVGEKSCYTWVFSTTMHVLYRCGVSRKKSEATDVLGDTFEGIGVTDDYAAYKDLFSQHQLCWAHLIRKAIKLALQNPEETEYAEFLDQLCLIYHDAKQSRDVCESDSIDSNIIVKQLQDRVKTLCNRCEEQIVTPQAAKKAVPASEPTESHTASFILLQRELANQLDCLFVFVEHPEVESTNNRSERNVRREAEIRKGARTSKSATGAKRRSIIVTIFASLATRMANVTLSAMLTEISRWLTSGTSVFQQELQAIQADIPPPKTTV